MQQVYKLPVFFRSAKGSYAKDGVIDNGREKVKFDLELIKNPHLQKKESMYSKMFEEEPQETQ